MTSSFIESCLRGFGFRLSPGRSFPRTGLGKPGVRVRSDRKVAGVILREPEIPVPALQRSKTRTPRGGRPAVPARCGNFSNRLASVASHRKASRPQGGCETGNRRTTRKRLTELSEQYCVAESGASRSAAGIGRRSSRRNVRAPLGVPGQRERCRAGFSRGGSGEPARRSRRPSYARMFRTASREARAIATVRVAARC